MELVLVGGCIGRATPSVNGNGWFQLGRRLLGVTAKLPPLNSLSTVSPPKSPLLQAFYQFEVNRICFLHVMNHAEEARHRAMAYYGSWCHRALYCVDILEAVLTESLERNEDTSMNCNTCVQAALVCRSFSETALRLVWRTLPDLNPLWKLFHQTTNIMHGSTFEATQGNGSRSTVWDDETWRMRPYSMVSSRYCSDT